ncbi:MAG: hypothetical protein FWG87_14180 [Defluviitaleaceae bacterium]|nr:hypothetical protein [Defluviitaleaceae bacterium]
MDLRKYLWNADLTDLRRFSRILSGLVDFRGFFHEPICEIRENPLNPLNPCEALEAFKSTSYRLLCLAPSVPLCLCVKKSFN